MIALHAQSVTWQLPGWRELFLKRLAIVCNLLEPSRMALNTCVIFSDGVLPASGILHGLVSSACGTSTKTSRPCLLFTLIREMLPALAVSAEPSAHFSKRAGQTVLDTFCVSEI